MMSKSKAALAAAVLMFTASAAMAQGGKFPSLDVEKNCRNRAKASEQMMGDKTVSTNLFTACVRSEKEAQAALSAAWKDIPANYRSMCIKPNDFSPSYVEWISCLEMNMDVKKLRTRTN